MYQSKKILGFIGARGGSKGIPNKNIVDFAGKPLIHWTIEASLGSKYIDRTIVSTDSEQIADVAKTSGAEAPFLRPKELAQDDSLIEEAVRHCLKLLEAEGTPYDYVVRLQPTSPLRTSTHIDEAICSFMENNNFEEETLVSVYAADAKAGWLMQEMSGGYINFCFDITKEKSQRQNMPKFFIPNGAIYISSVKNILKNDFYNGRTVPFLMDRNVSLDIDTQEDLKKAEQLFNRGARNMQVENKKYKGIIN